MSVFELILSFSEITLQLALLVLLLRGGLFRKYLAFGIYNLLGAILEPCEIAVYYRFGWRSYTYHTLFWSDQIALGLLLLLVVIVSTYQALGESKRRAIAGRALAAVTAIAVLIPVALLPFHHGKRGYGHFTTEWFSHTSQIMNFGGALMNLVLWAALLSNRKRDPKMVTLSIGLGVLTASAAIAWGVRTWLPAQDRWPVDTFLTVGHIASLVLWCWVFRPKSKARPPASNPVPPGVPQDALTTPS